MKKKVTATFIVDITEWSTEGQNNKCVKDCTKTALLDGFDTDDLGDIVVEVVDV